MELEQKINQFKEYQRKSKLPEFIVNIEQVQPGYFCEGKYFAQQAFVGEKEINYSTIMVDPNDYEHIGTLQGKKLYALKR